MHKIFNWKAARSGAHITIVGQDDAGGRVKISKIDLIEPRDVGGRTIIVATADSGQEYELAA